MKPQKQHEIKIEPSSPFNFDGTFFKPDHFSISHNYFEPETLWQTFNWQGNPLGIKFQNNGITEKPEIIVSIYADKSIKNSSLTELIEEIKYRYNLNLDLTEFYKLFKDHKYLKGPIKNLYGMRPGHPNSLYEYIVVGIVLQNASVRRSIQMFDNLIRNYGSNLQFDGQDLYCLWAPGRLGTIPEEELRALKIGYRAKSLLKVDEHFREGRIDELDLREKDVDRQKKELLAIYGVGPATIWYLLFDVFHRWEVFDHVSPWEQKLYSQMFFNRGLNELASTEEILNFIDQFGKYKHLAIHYMWEDLWWRRYKGEHIEWLEKEIRR